MTAMTSKLPNLQKERTRHGSVCWYVRIGRGKRIRIHGEYGSEEFMAEYRAAIEGAPLPGTIDKPEKDNRTLAWLVTQWRHSSDWANTKYDTRRQRDNFLGHILKASGHVPFTQITRQHILEGRERRKATPFAANNFLKLMRALFRWAEEAGYVDSNPATQVSSLKVKTDGFRAWTTEDVERFRKRWPLGTRERVALEVLVNTGLRRGDVVRLGPDHVKDGTISIRTEKTGAEIYIPILPALKKALDAGPTGETTFICNSKGKPWPKTSFGNWFKHACVAAKVEGSSHGLRKFAATMIAENGGSEKELQALFGWTTSIQSSIYTRAADKKRLAIQAAMKLAQSASV